MLTFREIFYTNIAQTSKNPIGLQIEKAEGCFLYDNNGKKYYDFISGTSVSNIGHNNPAVNEAIKKQLDKHLHVAVYGEFIQSSQSLLAQKITFLLPEKLNSVYFVNSGSEAVEGALKLAKRYTGRKKIISFKNCYHGSTHACMSLSDSNKYNLAFGPLLPDVEKIEINNIEQLNSITDQVACVILEPIQGEAGVIKANNEYLQLLRKKCDENSVLLILDEIQSGMGRTGKWFAFEHSGIVPDILLTAKAFGGGLPLGAFISSNEIMDTLTYNPPLGHITTFGGHPLSCAAAVATIDFIEKNNVLETVNQKNLFFKEFFNEHPYIIDLRAEGLLIAMQLDDAQKVERVCNACIEQGIIVDSFLYNEKSMRIAPPLTIEISQLEDACDKIQEILYKV